MEEPKVDVSVTLPEPEPDAPPASPPEPSSRESELLERLFDAKLESMKEELWHAVYDRAAGAWDVQEQLDELEARVDALAAFVVEEELVEEPPVSEPVTVIAPVEPPPSKKKKEPDEPKPKGAGALW